METSSPQDFDRADRRIRRITVYVKDNEAVRGSWVSLVQLRALIPLMIQKVMFQQPLIQSTDVPIGKESSMSLRFMGLANTIVSRSRNC